MATQPLQEIFPDLTILSIPLQNEFRGINYREVAVFRGTEGWSEFSPFLEYDIAEAKIWLDAALEAANNPWPELHRNKIAINATVPIVAPTEVKTILKGYSGCKTVKIKVDDFENGALVVEATLDHIPDAKIRLDVNGGWDQSTAISNLLEYHLRFGSIFEYVEQPCQLTSELSVVKAESPIPIAIDESIRKNLSSDLSQLSEVADVAILKWQPVGGFTSAHKIAETIGLPVVISSALETGIGISHGLALAASIIDSGFACGLGTVALLESDICNPAVLAENGFLEVVRREPAGLDKYRASAERVHWWNDRIMKILEAK